MNIGTDRVYSDPPPLKPAARKRMMNCLLLLDFEDNKCLTQLSSSVLNEMFDLVRENFHARLVLFIS